MSQHDYNITNSDGATVRADLNNALVAAVSNNSGASAPATTFAYMWWADTTTGLLKQRNAANSAWITIGPLATTGLGLAEQGANSTITSLAGLTTALSIAQGGTGVNALARSISANGYLTLPGGLIIQWGTFTGSTGGDSTLTYPIVFPNSLYGVMGSSFSGGTSDQTFLSIGVTSTTNCQASVWSAAGGGTRVARTAFWVAVGS